MKKILSIIFTLMIGLILLSTNIFATTLDCEKGEYENLVCVAPPEQPCTVAYVDDKNVFHEPSCLADYEYCFTEGCDAVIFAKDITIKKGSIFNVFTNVKAVDQLGAGKDLTKSLVAKVAKGSKPINTNRPGEYKITYMVKGANGNIVTLDRTIIVR